MKYNIQDGKTIFFLILIFFNIYELIKLHMYVTIKIASGLYIQQWRSSAYVQLFDVTKTDAKLKYSGIRLNP